MTFSLADRGRVDELLKLAVQVRISPTRRPGSRSELARGTGRTEALRRAKLRLLRQPRFAHPYYWAAFIPAGDWAPLPAGTLRRPEAR